MGSYSFGSRAYIPVLLLIMILFLSIQGLYLVGGLNSPVLVMVPLYFFAVLSLSAVYSPFFAFYSLLFIIPLQPFFTMPISGYASGLELKLLVALKEVLTVLAILLFIKKLKSIKIIAPDIAALVFIVVYTIGFLRAPFGAASIISLREGYMLALFYLLGRCAYLSGFEIKNLITTIGAVIAGVTLFGFVERFIIGEWFWGSWGAVEYLNSKFSDGSVVIKNYGGIPHNWFTFVGDERMRRMAGTVGDATSFGRYISFFVVSALFLPSFRRQGWAVVFGLTLAALILSLGRGGMLIGVIGLGVYLLKFKRYRILTLPGCGALVLVLLNTSLFDVNSGNSVRHMTGLTGGIDEMLVAPLGHGLGSSGQMAVLYSEVELEGSVSESYIGSLGYQLGIPAVLSYSVWMLALASLFFKLSSLNSSKNLKPYCLIGGALILGLYVTSYFANSAVAPISSASVMIFTGMLVEKIAKQREVVEAERGNNA